MVVELDTDTIMYHDMVMVQSRALHHDEVLDEDEVHLYHYPLHHQLQQVQYQQLVWQFLWWVQV